MSHGDDLAQGNLIPLPPDCQFGEASLGLALGVNMNKVWMKNLAQARAVCALHGVASLCFEIEQ
jgi:hypothetical protein